MVACSRNSKIKFNFCNMLKVLKTVSLKGLDFLSISPALMQSDPNNVSTGQIYCV